MLKKFFINTFRKSIMTCITCGGTGSIVEDGRWTPCPTCGGTGTVEA